VVPFLVRVLGPAGYGRLAFAQAFAQYFVVLTDYGFNLSATRAIVLAGPDTVRRSEIFSAVLSAKLGLCVLGFVLMSAISAAVPSFHDRYPLFLACYLAVVGNVLFPVWLYQGLQRMGVIPIFSVAGRVLLLVPLMLLVRRADQIELAALLWSGGLPLAGIAALIYAMRRCGVRYVLPSPGAVRDVLRDGWHVFTATAGGAVYNGSNTFMLGLVAAPEIVGYFAAADRIIKVLQSLVSPISQAVYPQIAAAMERARAQAFRQIGRVLRAFALGAAGVSLAVALFAGPIVAIVLGARFMPSVEILRLLAPWPLLIALNVVFGALFVVQLRLDRLLSFSILAPALLHLLLLYPVARYGGPQGLVLLMLGTEILVLAIRVVGLRRQAPDALASVLQSAVAA
jgi:Membrane protein involved in the export of O-antigen and teichoic acid